MNNTWRVSITTVSGGPFQKDFKTREEAVALYDSVLAPGGPVVISLVDAYGVSDRVTKIQQAHIVSVDVYPPLA